ncbi:MAG: xanthine dehydrogenase family protein molybdopterin-binding subunit, partial [Spirochaetota bacterium]
SLTVYVGTTEMGQGARTTMAKIAARSLGVPLDRVTVVAGDTGAVPFDSLTASSRSTVSMGNAVKSACERLRAHIDAIAAEHEDELAPAAETGAHRYRHAAGAVLLGDRSVPYPDVLAAHFGPRQGELEATGEYLAVRDASHPLGGPTPFYEYLVTGIELRVDRETGVVKVTKLVTMTDAGRIVNPRRAAGLDEGGAVMGLGFTFFEHLVQNEHGRILNPSSLDYRIPAIDDVPTVMHSEFLENGDGPGPFGEKGMGEGGILAIAPAAAAAIEQATGVRLRQLPFTAERIWQALNERMEDTR